MKYMKNASPARSVKRGKPLIDNTPEARTLRAKGNAAFQKRIAENRNNQANVAIDFNDKIVLN